jgi:hypothetical protein
MINYIKENCELPPLEKPLYDEDSDTWDLYFEEKGNCHWVLEDDLICLPFDTQEEASQIFNESLEIHAQELQILAEKEAELVEKEAKAITARLSEVAER